MPIVALFVVLGCLALLLAALPVALAVTVAIAKWIVSSGFLWALLAVAVIVPLLVWLDPRERRNR